MDERSLILGNNLENYRDNFYNRYESSNQTFLKFLYTEKKNFEKILFSAVEKQLKVINEDEDLNREKNELYNLFGEDLFNVLRDVKTRVSEIEYFSDGSVLEFIEDILNENGIYIFDDLMADSLPYRVDKLVNFLETYISMLWSPGLSIQQNKVIDFLNLEIIKEEIKIKHTSKQDTSNFPEPEPYQKETGRRNVPYKLALLRELKILDTLNIQYSDNKEQLYRILDYLTGANSKSYYLSMYGDNYKGKDRVTQQHVADLRNKGLI